MNYSKIIIITGTSRGLGLELVKQLADKTTHILAIARTINPEISSLAEKGFAITQLSCDLSDINQCESIIPQIQAVLSHSADEYWLINNAGTVNPINLIKDLTNLNDITQAFTLNVSSVIRLTQCFLEQTANFSAVKRIVNISSGAGRNPVAGWGVYCSTKAALDMFSRVISEEYKTQNVKVCSLAPGVIDTDMQATIRQANEQDFPDSEHFHELHKNGVLSSPEATAKQIIAYMEDERFGEKVLGDVRDGV